MPEIKKYFGGAISVSKETVQERDRALYDVMGAWDRLSLEAPEPIVEEYLVDDYVVNHFQAGPGFREYLARLWALEDREDQLRNSPLEARIYLFGRELPTALTYYFGV